MLYEGDLNNQAVGAQQLSAPVKVHHCCYLVAGGSPVQP
jgi:hypothetical protein